MGGVLLRVSVYIKVQTGRGQRAREHVTAEKAADSNCDILFLWGAELKFGDRLILVSLSLSLCRSLFRRKWERKSGADAADHRKVNFRVILIYMALKSNA